jgi:hypothetical protein
MNKKGIGAGIVAAGAAAAGYYFYASKNAAKNRRIAAKWATDLKKDVIRETKRLKKIDNPAVTAIVDRVSHAYENVRGLDRNDLKKAASELKDNAQNVIRELRKTAAAARKSSTIKRIRKTIQ